MARGGGALTRYVPTTRASSLKAALDGPTTIPVFWTPPADAIAKEREHHEWLDAILTRYNRHNQR